MPEPIDYKSAGRRPGHLRADHGLAAPPPQADVHPRVIEWPGGFAGLFRLDANIGLFTRTYRDPVLVASTDGVGTKLKLAFATGRHETVGNRPGGDVGQRLPLRRGRAAAVPRLRGHEPRRPEVDREGRPGDLRRLRRGRVRPARRRDRHPARLLPAGRVRPRRLLPRRGRPQADPRRQGDPARRQGHRPGQLGPALQRLQPGPQARLRGGRAGPRLVRPRTRPDRGRRIPPTDADLRPGPEDGLSPLPGQADRPRDRPHHRRRPDRQPAPDLARGDGRSASERPGTSPRSSPGSSRSATSPTTRCSASSTWGSAWS